MIKKVKQPYDMNIHYHETQAEFQKLFLSYPPNKYNDDINSEIDEQYRDLFLHLTYKKIMPENTIDIIEAHVCSNEKSDKMKALLDIRAEALKAFFRADLSTCIDYIERAKQQAKSLPRIIRNWFLVDLDNDYSIVTRWMQANNGESFKYRFDDRVLERSYFPKMTAYRGDQYKNICDLLMDDDMRPYTTEIAGGWDKVYKGTFNYFIEATNAFSISSLLSVRSKLIDCLVAWCSITSNTISFMNLMCLSIISNDGKRLKDCFRTYSFSSNLNQVTPVDIDSILDSIKIIPNELKIFKFLSFVYFLHYFAYYMTDTSFQYVMNEVKDNIECFFFGEEESCAWFRYRYIDIVSNAFLESGRRIDNNYTVDFVVRLLTIIESKNTTLEDSVLQILKNVAYDKNSFVNYVNEEYQIKLRDAFICAVNRRAESKDITPSFEYTASVLPQLLVVDTDDLVEVIRDKFPKIYDNGVELSRSNDRSSICLSYILEQCKTINTRNAQLTGSMFYDYGNNPFSTIYNILDDLETKDIPINELLTALESALFNPYQSCASKSDSLLIVTWLSINGIAIDRIENLLSEDNLTKVYKTQQLHSWNRTSTDVLKVNIAIIKLFLKHKSAETEMFSLLSAASNYSTYDIVKILASFDKFLSDLKAINYSESHVWQHYLVQFLFTVYLKNENDVRYYAVSCLLKLVGFADIKNIILDMLYKITRRETAGYIKIKIIKEIDKMPQSETIDSMKDYLLHDINYNVRTTAEHYFKK